MFRFSRFLVKTKNLLKLGKNIISKLELSLKYNRNFLFSTI